MKSKEAVPLKKVIKSLLGEAKSLRYLHGLDFAYIDSTDISNLLNGHTEKTLKCIIFGLDLDRDNTSILHLARTMLFSLSEDFYENGGDLYRQKYSDLEKASEQLTIKIKKMSKETQEIEKLIEEQEEIIEKARKNFFSFFFKKKSLNSKLEELKANAINIRSEVSRFREEVENINLLAKIEEYLKVLGMVLEVCIFPIRFNWALSG